MHQRMSGHLPQLPQSCGLLEFSVQFPSAAREHSVRRYVHGALVSAFDTFCILEHLVASLRSGSRQ